ncbi:hypothetical protein [uncultured Winogradskyella sp.]|uniref:hypothetical protein n=2 Tax=uncultured Winogradskyella sp. TaxID=395353 RepID=UPI0030EDA069|tara:strand:+ start:2263 stop:3012 length:750 start_codon:yes stop_codon:yes gene_type:complete
MLKFNFLPKFSIIIFCSFILFTIIGTLSHEFGHITVAEYFGYETKLNYGSMSFFEKGYYEDENVKEIENLIKKYKLENYENWTNDLKLKIEENNLIIKDRYPRNEIHDLWITIGGPAQTLLTSCIGLFILFLRRKTRKDQFKLVDWLAVFMSLFVLREVFNFITAIYGSMLYSKSNFHTDEFRISRYLGLNEWIIPTIALMIGLLISCYVVFKIIPIKYRFTFIVSGLVGGISGFAIWLGFLGEALFNS